ncbi:MAG: hypothetical protein QM612_06065 [Thermomonas sp.]|uniref:hypothetical protein n=1 Tax=Thermomonas sp. TaxID=1971895 RepID=UPI0039E24F9A
MKRIVVCIAILLALSSCKTGSKLARVDASIILPESASRMQLEKTQVFFMPNEIESPAPVFPADYPDNDADVTVCAGFVVSAEGEVVNIHQITDEWGCEPEDSIPGRALYPEVQSALSRWSYFAGTICTFEVDESECDGPDARLTPTAVRLAYRFRFLMSNGKKSVQAGKRVK